VKAITSFRGEYSFLSNFHRRWVEYKGEEYLTAEHAFQAQKVTNKHDKMWVMASISPGEAKRRGRRIPIRKDWNKVKDQIMYEVVKAKFNSSMSLRESLIGTKDFVIIEGNSWGDVYWGVDERTGYGQNKLGQILMRIREEL
jgi:ribA/ribD-fused uncharacterized protein